MMAIILLVLLLTLMTVLIHQECLIGIKNHLLNSVMRPQRWVVGATVLLMLFAHAIEISLFAIGYLLVTDFFSVGHLAGENSDGFEALLYFSFSSYTTLGIGDLYPTGAIRLMSGLEGLLGLLMIGWSASFLYLEMRTLWSDDTQFHKTDPNQY